MRWLSFALVPLLLSCVSDVPAAPDSSAMDAPQTTDTGTSGDGGMDVQTDAGPQGSCATNFPMAIFCDDFDTGMPKPGWMPTGDPGMITTALAFSPPNGFRFATPQTNVAVSSTISRDVSGGSTEWSLLARVHVDTFSGPNANLSPPIVLSLQFGGSFWSAVIDPTIDHAWCAGLGANKVNDSIAQHASWHLIKLTLAKMGADLLATCGIDSYTGTTTASNTSFAMPATIIVGIHALSGQGAFSIAYDDVVFTAK